MPLLTDILPYDLHLLIPNNKKPLEIKGITADSRFVQKDYLFTAIKGTKTDGFTHIAAAIKAGASVVVCEMDHPYIDAAAQYPDILFVPVPMVRYALSQALANFYSPLPTSMVAVTGTNGKTSVAEFTRQLCEILQIPAASFGTLGIYTPQEHISLENTTGNPEEIYRHLSKLKKDKIEHVIFEASSHGLDQYRLHGLSFKGGGFTNLSQDHLDYHPHFEAYAKAKQILFDDLILSDHFAILYMDTPYSEQMHHASKRSGLQILTISEKQPATFFIQNRTPTPQGNTVTILYKDTQYSFDIPLYGSFQIHNLLMAVGLTHSLTGHPIDNILPLIPQLSCIHGRMEKVGIYNGGIVFIDYAHTPDALEKAILSLRDHTDKKIITVFGCGGDRDTTKRPLMGSIAETHSDHIIVTNDNPRFENPEAIAKDILSGVSNKQKCQIIFDRQEAIETGMQLLQKGDILLIAGKGHETGQSIQGKKIPFYDKKAVEEILSKTSS